MGLLFLEHGNPFIACWCTRSPASGHGVSRAFQQQGQQQQHKATHFPQLSPITPPHSLIANENLVFDLCGPKFPIFPLSIQNFPHFSPFPPIFPKSAHFKGKCTVMLPANVGENWGNRQSGQCEVDNTQNVLRLLIFSPKKLQKGSVAWHTGDQNKLRCSPYTESLGRRKGGGLGRGGGGPKHWPKSSFF